MKDSTKQSVPAQTQKLESLGKFACGIVHDFNNILSLIEGHTNIAVRQLKEGTLTPAQLQKIQKSAQKGAGLTRQLLAFGYGCRKGGAQERSNIVDVLHQLQALLRPLLDGSIRVFMAVPEEPVWVNAAPEELTRLVMNLALNARDAMPSGGELSIACIGCQQQHIPHALREKYPETSFVRLSIIDSGEGIAAELLPRIFEPFFTTKDRSRGSGLGLSIVADIVEQLNGYIEVSSVPGEGTSFEIYLPRLSPAHHKRK